VTAAPTRRALRAVGLEFAGVAGALVLALVAVAHAASSGSSQILFYDADSLTLPLLRQALEHGGPLHFVFSTTLFAPEAVIYLAAAAVTSTVQGAIATAAVVNLLVFYGLARGAAAVSVQRGHRTRRVLLAVTAQLLFTLFVLVEGTGRYNSFELFTPNLTGTYYWTIIVGTGFTAVLTAAILRDGLGRRATVSAVGIGLLAIGCTISSQLYIPWSALPVIVTVALLVVLRRITWRLAFLPVVALVAGAVIATIARIPLQPYLNADALGYVHLFRVGRPVVVFGKELLTSLHSIRDVVEVLGMLAVVVLTVVFAITELRRRAPLARAVLPLISAITSVSIPIGTVLVGQEATRYLIPAVVLPVLFLPASLESLLPAVLPPRARRPLAVVATVALAVGAVVAPIAVGRAVPSTRDTQGDCLVTWLDGRDLVGAGQYWTIRPIQAYHADVRLLPIEPLAKPYLWLNDLDAYRVANVDYLVVDAPALALGWGTALQQAFGAPATIQDCGGYQIYDYDGTARQADLTRHVVQPVEVALRQRGWD
jgi:hypothetical protein